jgi:hypothetical protein
MNVNKVSYSVEHSEDWNGKPPPFEGSVYFWRFVMSAEGVLYADHFKTKPTSRQIRKLVKHVKQIGRDVIDRRHL